MNERMTRNPWLRTFLFTFVAFSCLRVWVSPPSFVSTAQAQIPEPARQRNAALKEAKRTNELLDAILKHLKSGVIKVELPKADKRGGAQAGA